MKRLVVGMSGASAAIYGIRLLQVLRDVGIESHLVITDPAREIIALETAYDPSEVEALAAHVHAVQNVGAVIASGSFKTGGMVIVPCSIKTLSAVANSYADNLLVRAADVTLKERRPLVLVVRETPLHLGHLRLMQKVSEMGALVYVPVPAFYTRPRTIEDLLDHTVGRILDLFDVEHDLVTRWEGLPGA
jgi:4-hydroxy-3-polyprenylbenzoate decarboxylase